MTDLSQILEIKEFGEEGVELLSSMHKIGFKNQPEQSWAENEFREVFSINGTKSYVVSRGGEPIGFVLLRIIAEEVEIITFCMLPKWCNNGYSTYLLEQIIKKLQLQSIKRLFLEVRENNDAAIRLYNKCSFKVIGRRTGYYNNHLGSKIDALVMQRQLIV